MSDNVIWARRWVVLSATVIKENREYLIELDRKIGDGDHGENLDRGCSALLREGGIEDIDSAAGIFRNVARIVMSVVGGAAGPLLGTAFQQMAAVMPDEDLTAQDISRLVDAGLGGLQKRGRAEAGEKTMTDTWLAAAAAARVAAKQELDPAAAWQMIAEAAEEGAQATIPMKATKGRASYLGDRSIGHLDPGAVSSSLLFLTAAQAAAEVWGGDAVD